jgi:nitrite reductase/ring-hydroxylating ferredoxin subunit
MRSFRVGEREVLLCRTREGVFALDNVCTHAEARMSEGSLRGTRLTCPLHGASFSVTDGSVLGGPATVPLRTHAVRVAGEQIEVSCASPSA